MSKDNITIIEVSLGASIDSIIADNLTEITEQNQNNINQIIAESKAVSKIHEAKQLAAKTLTNKVETAYLALLEADAAGETTPASILLEIVQPEIGTIGALVPRIKTLMKSKDDPRKLSSMKHKGNTYYYLAE